jgi:hypothetical protein
MLLAICQCSPTVGIERRKYQMAINLQTTEKHRDRNNVLRTGWSALVRVALAATLVAGVSGSSASPASASPVPVGGPRTGLVVPGVPVVFTLPNGHIVEMTSTVTGAGGVKGASRMAVNSYYAELTFVEYFACYCAEAWRYTLHTDFNWENGYLYLVNDRDILNISGAGYVAQGRYVGHFTLQSDPNNGWAMVVRSYGHIEMQMWDGPVLIATCVVDLYNDVNGWGGANQWYTSSQYCGS